MKEVIKVSQATWKMLQEKVRQEEKKLQELKTQRVMKLSDPINIIDKGQGVFDQVLDQKRFDELQKMYDSCIPIDNPQHTDYVVLGHRVTLEKGGKQVILVIDGIALHSGMMSIKSKIGQKILGKKVGDVVSGIKIIKIQ